MKNPIFVEQEVTMMQLYYKPTGEEGMLSIRVNDMVFIDRNKKLVRPTFSKDSKKPIETEGTGFFSEMYVLPYCPPGEKYFEKYLAYFAKEEKGFIIFKQNLDTQKLELSFENRGRDQIIIDHQSIWNIETQLIKWRVKDIKIRDLNDNIIYKLSIDEIKNQIFGKKIDPGGAIKIPLISLKDLQKNTSYHITIGTGEESKLEEVTNQKRIIKWVLGDSPYYYPRYRFNNDLYLYRLNVAQDGSISFEKVRSR